MRVRIGEHEGFSRIVFDWPGAVDYQVTRDGGEVVIRFDRAARIDLANLNASPLQFIHAGAYETENGVTRVILQIAPTARLRHFRAELRVVIDAIDEPAKAEAAPPTPEVDQAPAGETPEAETQAAETQAAEIGGDEAPDAAMETAMAPDATPDAPLDLVTGTAPSAEPAAATADGAFPDLPPATTGDGAGVVGGDRMAAEADTAPRAVVEAQAAGDTQAAGESQSTDGSGPNPDAASTLEPTAVAAQTGGMTSAQLTLGPPPLKIAVETGANDTLIIFNVGKRLAAAAFIRAGYLWVAFPKLYAVDLAALKSIEGVGFTAIELREHADATLLRFKLLNGYGVSMRRRGVLWLLRFSTTPAPSVGLDVETIAINSPHPRVRLPIDNGGERFTLRDPYDRAALVVMPILASGVGVAKDHRFPDFELLATVQGIVAHPSIGQLDIRTSPGGIEIASYAALEQPRDSVELVKRRARPVTALFNLAVWRRGGEAAFAVNWQALQRAVAWAPPSMLKRARLELLRFLFAHGFYSEAFGILRVLTAEDPGADQSLSLRAMRGVIYLERGQILKAETDLGDPAFYPYDDIALWRGVLAMRRGDKQRAWDYFAQAGDLWLELPPPLRGRMGLMAAEAALEGGDLAAANAHLDTVLSMDPVFYLVERANHLRGRAQAAAGNEDNALAIWRDVIRGRDRLARARALYDDTVLMLKNGHITADEALAELENLRYVWRGDDFELTLLQRLAALYAGIGDYRHALVTMKLAVTYFADYPAAAAIAARMNRLFADIFLRDGAEDMAAIDALTLYYEFQELTPVGRDGDEVIQKLADRLVALDLLDRAAELLTHQLKYRLKGIEKARVGTRLAVIHLMNRNPKAAIRVLRQSRSSKLPFELATQRRHLRARALADLGRDEDALKRLAGDTSRDAELLRADIYWRAGKWPEVARATERLLALTPTEAPLNPFASRHILRLAVALALAGDRDGMTRLRAEFAAAMRNDPNQQEFDVISEDSASLATSFRELPAAIAQIAGFEAFMTSYRERVKSDSLSAIN